MITTLIDIKLIKFLFVGAFNTVLCLALMLCLYNIVGMSYWSSTAIVYFFGGIISFFLNKNFTFKNNDGNFFALIKFIINIVICYLIAYYLAKKLIISILSNANQTIQENIAMLFALVLFTVLNYLGQRFFVFLS